VITTVSASLTISNDHPRMTVGHISAMLGIEPTVIWEYGDPWPSKTRPDRLRSHGAWRFEEPRTIAATEDPHGMESLVRLAERFEPVADRLAELSKEFDIRVGMFGSSDSTQAGFFVGAETMRRLGLLSAAFVPDIYLSEDLYVGDLEGRTPELLHARASRRDGGRSEPESGQK